MESRIEKQLQGKKPSEITELLLDNCKSEKILGLTEEFSNLAILSMVEVGLVSLEGLPKLPLLSCINLSDNKLTGGLEILADSAPKLSYIILSGNSLKNIDVLQPLVKLSKLLNLELCSTGLDDLPNYRQKVFEMLPQLKHLDGAGLDETDRSDEDDSSDEDISMGGISDDSTDDSNEEIERQRKTYLKSSGARKNNELSDEITKDEDGTEDENVKPNEARGVKHQRESGEEADGESESKSS